MSTMDKFSWKEDKNAKIKKERNLSFEDVVEAIASGHLLAILDGTDKYPHQQRFVINLKGYPHVVPFFYEEGVYHLITMMKDRRFKHLIDSEKHE